MSRHEDEKRLGHMLDHAQETVAMVKGRARTDLDADRQLNLALVRLVEIVGEAANRVSKERQRIEDAVPQSEIVGMRNRIVHGYDDVDFDILWAVIHQDLPPPIGQLGRILGR